MQYYVLAGTGGVNAMMVNQQRSTFAPNATYNGSLIVTQNARGPSCTHFQPYIDLTTGELMAEVSHTQHLLDFTHILPTQDQYRTAICSRECH